MSTIQPDRNALPVAPQLPAQPPKKDSFFSRLKRAVVSIFFKAPDVKKIPDKTIAEIAPRARVNFVPPSYAPARKPATIVQKIFGGKENKLPSYADVTKDTVIQYGMDPAKLHYAWANRQVSQDALALLIRAQNVIPATRGESQATPQKNLQNFKEFLEKFQFNSLQDETSFLQNNWIPALKSLTPEQLTQVKATLCVHLEELKSAKRDLNELDKRIIRFLAPGDMKGPQIHQLLLELPPVVQEQYAEGYDSIVQGGKEYIQTLTDPAQIFSTICNQYEIKDAKAFCEHNKQLEGKMITFLQDGGIPAIKEPTDAAKRWFGAIMKMSNLDGSANSLLTSAINQYSFPVVDKAKQEKGQTIFARELKNLVGSELVSSSVSNQRPLAEVLKEIKDVLSRRCKLNYSDDYSERRDLDNQCLKLCYQIDFSKLSRLTHNEVNALKKQSECDFEGLKGVVYALKSDSPIKNKPAFTALCILTFVLSDSWGSEKDCKEIFGFFVDRIRPHMLAKSSVTSQLSLFFIYQILRLGSQYICSIDDRSGEWYCRAIATILADASQLPQDSSARQCCDELRKRMHLDPPISPESCEKICSKVRLEELKGNPSALTIAITQGSKYADRLFARQCLQDGELGVITQLELARLLALKTKGRRTADLYPCGTIILCKLDTALETDQEICRATFEYMNSPDSSTSDKLDFFSAFVNNWNDQLSQEGKDKWIKTPIFAKAVKSALAETNPNTQSDRYCKMVRMIPNVLSDNEYSNLLYKYCLGAKNKTDWDFLKDIKPETLAHHKIPNDKNSLRNLFIHLRQVLKENPAAIDGIKTLFKAMESCDPKWMIVRLTSSYYTANNDAEGRELVLKAYEDFFSQDPQLLECLPNSISKLDREYGWPTDRLKEQWKKESLQGKEQKLTAPVKETKTSDWNTGAFGSVSTALPTPPAAHPVDTPVKEVNTTASIAVPSSPLPAYNPEMTASAPPLNLVLQDEATEKDEAMEKEVLSEDDAAGSPLNRVQNEPDQDKSVSSSNPVALDKLLKRIQTELAQNKGVSNSTLVAREKAYQRLEKIYEKSQHPKAPELVQAIRDLLARISELKSQNPQ